MFASLPNLGQAQSVGVDAGSLDRRNETLDAVPPTAQTLPPLARPPEDRRLPGDGGATIFLQGWAFDGNSVFGDDVLGGVLGPFTGRELTFAEIAEATRAIEGFYADRGFLARVNVPAQEVVGNVVRLEIVEARYGGARRVGDQPARLRADAATRPFDAALAEGSLLRPDRLDRPLLIANDLHGIAVGGVLAPGDSPGETILLLDIEETDPFRAVLSYDNHGSRATGEERLGLDTYLASPFGQGGALTFEASLAEGNRRGALRYAVPLGARGLQAQIGIDGLT
ncbi:MAG: POTRA domain-containing protein [Roseicyclus sp.]